MNPALSGTVTHGNIAMTQNETIGEYYPVPRPGAWGAEDLEQLFARRSSALAFLGCSLVFVLVDRVWPFRGNVPF
jgi:hypothetical protein